MTAVESVQMTRPCPACGLEVAWRGACVSAGGATAWTIPWHPGCVEDEQAQR